MKATRAYITGPRKVELREDNLEPKEGEVLVQVAACGLCSSEIPGYEAKRDRPLPYVMGHEGAGTVVQVGRGAKGWQPGDRVTGVIKEAFASHGLARAEELVRVPVGVPLEHALGEPLFCITNVARGSNPQFGDFAVLIGCGAMGLLTLAALKGAFVSAMVAVDLFDWRLDVARELGATDVINAAKEDVASKIAEMTEGRGADLVIEFTGKPGGLELGAKVIKRGQGKLVMAGYHHSPATYNLADFAHKGIIMHTTHPYYSPDQPADYRRAMAALGAGVFPMGRLITNRYALADLAQGFEDLIASREGYLKGIVAP